MEQKRNCRICGKNKSISDFYPTYAKGGGQRRVCKKCFLKQNKEYQLAHREEKLTYLKSDSLDYAISNNLIEEEQ